MVEKGVLGQVKTIEKELSPAEIALILNMRTFISQILTKNIDVTRPNKVQQAAMSVVDKLRELEIGSFDIVADLLDTRKKPVLNEEEIEDKFEEPEERVDYDSAKERIEDLFDSLGGDMCDIFERLGLFDRKK